MLARYLSLQRLLWWPEIACPLDWGKVYAQGAPVVLEIGFGNGEYLLRQSEQRPDHNFLGLELHWGSIRRALRRLHAAGRDNARLLQMDAQMAVRYLLAPASLREFYALFPCPWPKRDHTRHRLFSRPFLSLLARALEFQGCGLIVTDHSEFRDFVLAESVNSGLTARCDTVPAGYDTKYERRWTAQGQREFFEIHFSKDADASGIPALQEVPVKSRHIHDMPADGPQPRGVRGPLCIEFKRRIFDAEQQIYMFLVIASEDGLAQTFWIEVAFRQASQQAAVTPAGPSPQWRWVIRPAQGSAVLPTAGVQKALDLVFESCTEDLSPLSSP